MAKKLKYQLSNTIYVDNDIVRCSDAFRNLNKTQINLFLFICCLAKQQYDINKDIETDGEETGWSDEIIIDMNEFNKSSGRKTAWCDLEQEKKEIILSYFDSLQDKTFIIYKTAKRRRTDGYTKYNYLYHTDYDKETKLLHLKMPENTRLFFMNYDNFFTPYEIGQIIQLQSEASKLLYIYLRSFWDNNKKVFLPTSLSIDNFRDVVGKKNEYKEYYDLKRHVLEKAIEEINEKTDIIISGDYDRFRKLTEDKNDLTPEEKKKYHLMSMEMHNDEKNKKRVSGLTFRMKMKPESNSVNYYDAIFSDEIIEERMKRKAIAKAMKKGKKNG